ncbi:hypothetical protein J0H58_21740 [bacterium]|nr:hypothetical protein [bacterium]
MTAIFYPDCSTTSDGGRYTLEARSPHNGSIPCQDGRMPADDFPTMYRQLQRDFRYRLLDNQEAEPARTDGMGVVWERWQPRRENSPHELLVSPDGWAVIGLASGDFAAAVGGFETFSGKPRPLVGATPADDPLGYAGGAFISAVRRHWPASPLADSIVSPADL